MTKLDMNEALRLNERTKKLALQKMDQCKTRKHIHHCIDCLSFNCILMKKYYQAVTNYESLKLRLEKEAAV
jgi:hypothetical protein